MKKILFTSIAVIMLSCSRERNNEKSGETKNTEKALTFKTENMSFVDAPDIPKKMWLSSSTYYENSLYVSNGAGIYEFNTINSEWKALPNFSNSTSYWGNLMTNGYHITFLNGLKNGALNSIGYVIEKGNIYKYDLPNQINARSAGYAEAYGKHYLAGGSDALEKKFKTEIYQMSLGSKGEITNIVKLTDMPEAKNTQIEIINQKIYVIGGYDGQLASKRIDFYDMKTKKWTFVGEMPYGFSSHATAVYNDKIWIIGNYNLNDQQLAYYDIQENAFVTVNSNIKPRRHANAEIINGKLYVFSGSETSSITSALTSMQVTTLK